MQLVLSNNRVLAHGENFISMGGTVINTETNKVYQNATVAECDGCPSDIGVVGYEYHAGEFVPCAPFGKGPGNIAVYCDDCKTPRDSGKHIGFVCTMSSYMAFVGNVNADMVDAAFGKGNEDIIMGVGEALAMYGWFKGMDKTEHPFTHLRKMQTLNDMNNEVYKEIAENETLFFFIVNSDYAADKVFSVIQAEGYLRDLDDGVDESEKNVYVNFEVTEEDLTVPFYFTFSASASKANPNEANVYINDVLAQSYWYQEDGGSTSAKGFANWSDYNITAPGTYTIRTYLDVYPDDSDWVSSSFCMYKSK